MGIGSDIGLNDSSDINSGINSDISSDISSGSNSDNSPGKLEGTSPERRRLNRPFLNLLLAFLLVLSFSSATFSSGVELLSPTAYADVQSTDLVDNVSIADHSIADAPDIQADYAAVATADGTILWERNGKTETPMASTTKIMTAVIALENAKLDSVFLVTAGAAGTSGTSAGLKEGDKVTLYNLLIALLLPSGNDAGVAIAVNISGTEYDFCDKMNKKAADLGMTQTHFSDAHGLIEVNHYTTVEDYLILARYAMQNETFRNIVKEKQMTAKIGDRDVSYQNTNQLFDITAGTSATAAKFDAATGVAAGTYVRPGWTIKGIKTGTNNESEACLVSCVEYQGIELYAIVFKSPTDTTRYQDTMRLYDWAFKHYWKAELISPEHVVANMALTDWIDKSVPVSVPNSVVLDIFDCRGPIQQEVDVSDWKGSVKKGDKVGRIVWSQNGEVIDSSDLVATADQPAPSFWQKISIGWDRFWGGFSGSAKHMNTEILVPTELKTADSQ
jgi:D-alanyl-D-alanine carboxypeptidase (penicillin-binding protein 5/6)